MTSDGELSLPAAIVLYEEGIRLAPYRDSLGLWTVGVGRCLSTHPLSDGERMGLRIPAGVDVVDYLTEHPLSVDEAVALFEVEVDEITQHLPFRIPWYRDLDAVRAAVLVSMAYQMGIGSAVPRAGLLGFQRTLGFMSRQQWDGAAAELLVSRWSRQTPQRAARHAESIRTGRLLPADLEAQAAQILARARGEGEVAA